MIEVLVKPGDTVKAEDALVSLESDKATMDVPAPLGGVVGELKVKVGDKVSEGTVILTLVTDSAAGEGARRLRRLRRPRRRPPLRRSPQPRRQRRRPRTASTRPRSRSPTPGPGVRKLARELGVESRRGQGERRERPHPEGRRRRPREGRAGGARGAAPAAAARGGRRRHRAAAVAEGRLREVRPDRSEAAGADQEDLRREPAPQLGDDPARHQSRRRRHHRPRGLPRAVQQGEREERRQGQHARVHDQGGGGDA